MMIINVPTFKWWFPGHILFYILTPSHRWLLYYLIFILYLDFSGQDFDKAIELYTQAIQINPNPIYYANRSFAYFKTESIGYALNDASKAIELDKTYTKAYYRRAAAYMSLGKFKLALKDYETVSQFSLFSHLFFLLTLAY